MNGHTSNGTWGSATRGDRGNGAVPVRERPALLGLTQGQMTVLLLLLFLAGIGISLCVAVENLEEQFRETTRQQDALRQQQEELQTEVDRLLRVLGAHEAIRAANRGLDRGTTRRIAWCVVSESERNGLSPELVLGVIAAESSFRPGAVSSRGARGLMQLMPGTARALGVRDAHDVAENVRAGVRYLAVLRRRFGRTSLALLAYHAGPTRVARGAVPAESTRYVARVLRYAVRFAEEVGT